MDLEGKKETAFCLHLNLKVKKEKKQSDCTNPDPWLEL